MRNQVRFLLDGQWERIDSPDPTGTLLEWLRERKKRVGTKEGCAEGDCGACTVLVGSVTADDRMLWRAVNSCILFLPMLDGRALLTVENLAVDDLLHPVQQAMVDHHGSQCGFCTPGIVMSLYGRAIGAEGTRDVASKDVLAGNLCRCTGYGPILAAAEKVPHASRDDEKIIAALKTHSSSDVLAVRYDDPLSKSRRRWFSPRTIEDLAALYEAHPDAQIVAGATDVGLWVTKKHRILHDIIGIDEIADLQILSESDDGVTIGAGVRYADAQAVLARLHPDLGELVRRIGAVQVRNAGTIGGNIANGSPIGDMPPALIALGADLILRRGDVRRRLKLEDYFLAYGRQDRQPGEFVEQIFVPRPHAEQWINIAKLSKRLDSDISAVCGAVMLTLKDGMVADARLAYGGMAATPKRASAAEKVLIGGPFDRAAMDRAADALAIDFAPLSDMRGSSAYRLRAAGNLLRRFWLRSKGAADSVLSVEAIDA